MSEYTTDHDLQVYEDMAEGTSYIETKIKEFHDKFVEPINSELRAMNLNGEAYIVKGTAKDIEEFIREALERWRENDISSWINYGRERKYFDYLKEHKIKF